MRAAAVIVVSAAVAATVAGCGSTGHFVAAKPIASPVNLSIYIANGHVQLSPGHAGAGPVLLLVTNQAARSETLTVHSAGRGGVTLATTGPINPDSTAQVQVNLTTPGDYALSADRAAPARLRIGAPRAGDDNQLLQP